MTDWSCVGKPLLFPTYIEQGQERRQIGNRAGLFIREYKQSVATLQLIITNITQICVSHHYMFYVVISDHNYHLIAMEIVSSI